MIKIRKKILAVLLTAAMLVSMSSLVAWSDEQPATDDGTSQTEQTTDDGGCSLSEMSGILGISYQAVRYKLRKARSMLLKETEVKNEQH